LLAKRISNGLYLEGILALFVTDVNLTTTSCYNFMQILNLTFASRGGEGESEVEWGCCSDEQSEQPHSAEHLNSPE